MTDVMILNVCIAFVVAILLFFTGWLVWMWGYRTALRDVTAPAAPRETR